MKCVYEDGTEKVLEYSVSLELSGIIEINASNLGLTEWNAKLPEGLHELWIYNNELTEWNVKLPKGLQKFSIYNNELQWVCEGIKAKTICKKESIKYYVPSLCCDIVDPPGYVNIKKVVCEIFRVCYIKGRIYREK